MKEKIRKGLSIALSVCIIVGMMPVMAFGESSNDSYNYVSLGASNVNGYGLRGYISAMPGMTLDETMEAAALNSDIKASANVLGYLQAPKQSYPALIQNELMKEHGNVQLNQLAISSMRVEELRILLDKNYTGDPYSEWRFVGKGNWFDIADGKVDGDYSTLSNEYIDYVKNANLITLDTGTNNFGVYLGHSISGSKLGPDGSNIEKYIDKNIGSKYNKIKSLIGKAIETVGVDLNDIGDVDNILDAFSYALIGFCYNYDKVVGEIYKLNPDVKLVAVSIQNILAGVNMSIDGVKLPVGDIIGALVNLANAYIATGSPYCNKYYYADVRQDGHVDFFINQIARYNGDVSTLSIDAIDCFNVYDGSPGNTYDHGYHIKYHVYKELLKTASEARKSAALLRAYDAYAQFLKTAARIDTIDYKLLSINTDVVDREITNAVLAEVDKAALSTEGYAFPSDFFDKIAEKCGVETSVVKGLASYNVRTGIGNSFFAHPTPNGHKEIAEKVLEALHNKSKGKSVVGMKQLIDKLSEILSQGSCKHIWDSEYTTDVKPTCTEQGVVSIHCRKCNETKLETVVPATGHRFSEWIADTENVGKEYRVCSVCSFIEKRNQKLEPVAKALKSGKIKFSWKKINGVAKYNVYIGKHGKKLKKVATITKTTYTIKKLAAKKSYDLRVTAYDAKGNKIKRSSVLTCRTKA